MQLSFCDILDRDLGPATFYRLPRQLIYDGYFDGLSAEAKLLYCLMLDRAGLSKENGWFDPGGRVFIYFTIFDVQSNLGCGHSKAKKLMDELDEGSGIGLIRRKYQGLGKPSKIYVKKIVESVAEMQHPGLPKSSILCS